LREGVPPILLEHERFTRGIPGAAKPQASPGHPAQQPSIHPRPDSRHASHTPPDANGVRLQSNRSGIIASIALRAFKAFLPFAVAL